MKIALSLALSDSWCGVPVVCVMRCEMLLLFCHGSYWLLNVIALHFRKYTENKLNIIGGQAVLSKYRWYRKRELRNKVGGGTGTTFKKYHRQRYRYLLADTLFIQTKFLT